MPTETVGQTDLTDSQFNQISALVKTICGINLHDGKKELVKCRLQKRIRALGLNDFRQYIDYLGKDAAGNEVTAMLDAISTNQTSFFREADHFDYLSNVVLPRWRNSQVGPKRLTIWSAGCSSGEEPYSIAMTVCEALESADALNARILATDISTRMLTSATTGTYDAKCVESIPPLLRSRHVDCAETGAHRSYRISPAIRRMVHFARLNLIGRWPMRGLFHAIFCRNVMIYFDKPTREKLIDRFWDLLAPGGIFFVGHSEGLTGIRHEFRNVQPTVYEKP